jgi:hypothetical protein
MNMKILLKVTLVVVMLLFLNQGVSAQQLQIPKQGTASYVTYYTGRSLTSLNMGEVGSEALGEIVGITRNTDGQKFFDNMTVRCILYSQTLGGKRKANGACTETDSDGDKVFTTFDSGTMMHTLIGGTGKYKGISGTAPYTSKVLPPPGEGLSASIVDHKVTWEFK